MTFVKTGFFAPLALGAAVLALSACAPEEGTTSGEEASAASSEIEIEQPDELPPISETDALVQLTCNDFLAAAAVAQDETNEGAAIAAQDALVTALTWLHGYRYASDPDLEVISEAWMARTAEEIYTKCGEADDPSTLNLFEVATS